MTFNETTRGIGSTPASYIVNLENTNKDEVVSRIFMQFSMHQKLPFTVEVDITVYKGEGIEIFKSENREEQKISITSKDYLAILISNKTKLFKHLKNDVITTMISAYLPTNWFMELL